MRFFTFALIGIFLCRNLVQAAPDGDHSPKLLLNSQRLRRLKRDRERQTSRWINLEHRLQTVPNSPERGFELALYAAITNDQSRAKEAVVWADAHPCEIRQVAVIMDWVSVPVPAATKKCQPNGKSELEQLRDLEFLAIASGTAPPPSPDFIPAVTKTGFEKPGSLYSAIEYLDAVRSSNRQDLREGAVTFFFNLPVLFLLSLPPQQLSNPGWQMHAAALALVSLDPNLEGSQFLQAWAMEDPQTIRDGPGVAYEFLWADPYLPGVSYRNMEPALYDEEASKLIARTSWDEDACRIQITPTGANGENCPANWQSRSMDFGHLMLIPLEEHCVELTRRPSNTTTILWKLRPHAKLFYAEDGKQQGRNADAAGMWRVSAEYYGKVCAGK